MHLIAPFITRLPWAWAGIRVLRGFVFRALGRDPLGARIRYRDELASVYEVRSAHLNPPSVIDERHGRKLWRTSLGELWMPGKGSRDYVLQLEIESRLNVYRFQTADTVIDCGANVGTFCRQAIRAGARRVIAFEPDCENVACLRENMADAVVAGRVTVVEKGVWSKPDRLWLSSKSTAHPGSSTVCAEPDDEGYYIDLTTIDSVVEELRLEKVDFLKMDIEGAEVEALKGARRTIERFRPVIALGTEHTADIYENNLRVLAVISEICPDYRHEVTEAHAYRSPRHGWMLTPHSMIFRVLERQRT
jgi:FkbM family methyltransferase